MRNLIIAAVCVCIALTLPANGQLPEDYPAEVYSARRTKMYDKIGKGFAVILGEREPRLPLKFRQSNDLYYFCGIEEPNAILVLDGSANAATLFLPERDARKVRAEGPSLLSFPDDVKRAELTAVKPLSQLTGFLRDLAMQRTTAYLQLNSRDTVIYARSELDRDQAFAAYGDPWDGRESREHQFANHIHSRFPHLQIVNVNLLIDELRWVKDEYEIAQLRKAGELGSEAVIEAMRATQPGIYQYELEAVARFILTKNGARGEAFPAIVASGADGLIWHWLKNSSKMQDGDVVLLDYGADYNYYTCDITRTWPISGKFTPEQLKLYTVIRETSQQVIEAIKPGVTIKELVEIARRVFDKHGFGEYFLGGIGHPVGMSEHDVRPGTDEEYLNRPFQPGVVFNVEPIIEDKTNKIHLRIEDTVLVTQSGHEVFTRAAPTDVDDIYATTSSPSEYFK